MGKGGYQIQPSKFAKKYMADLQFPHPIYNKWHEQHHTHHATSGNLDKRGVGDVWTLTVDEYLKSSKWKRFLYRAFRDPFIMFTFGPVFVVFVQNRMIKSRMSKSEKWNVHFTNL